MLQSPPAKMKYVMNPSSLTDMIEDFNGGYVLCCKTNSRINIEDLRYWNVDKQVAYCCPEVIDPREFRSYSNAHR